MIILLSIEESDDQVVAGFPEYVKLVANPSASTIFYTLDGSEPNPFTSEMLADLDGILKLPTDGTTLTLKAIAAFDVYSSATLEKTYFTNQKNIDKNRLLGKEGIRVYPAGATPINNLSYDADGFPSQQSVIPIEKMDLRGSTTNNRGEDIPGDTTLDFINFAKKQTPKSKPIVSSPNDNNTNFDPKAQYIVIDGSTEEKLNNQIVRIINRPHGTMDLVSPIYNRNMPSFNLNTSNFVRYMINPVTNLACLYYRDSREGRWIRSVQHIEPKGLNLTATASPPNSFVFRWIEDRAQSRIY
jgi:hypothetical protein